ncbi:MULTISPECIES: hypothetical protein [Streptomyces]|uniref:Lipoprotein n=1 Tax=Streptomyces ramulosus TaxID=47762 RepID=A0ABW1FLP8_9ACTN
MGDRVGARRMGWRTAVPVGAVLLLLLAAGAWGVQAGRHASAVDVAPQTSAARQRPAPGQAPQKATAGGLPGVRDCGFGEPEVEPQVITLTCADSGMVATGIVWERYGRTSAEGRGVVQVEKAAAGTAGDAVFPARFRLYGVRTVEGGRAFTGLEVTYDGSTPMGDTTEMYSLA